MQKLILITGEAWTGKSTCAELIYKKFDNSAWLDGDDVWRVNPFSCNDSRLRNSDYSMAFVVDNYLKSKFEYVVFSSIVLCNENIRNRILNLINEKDYELIFITLYASKNVLAERAMIRDRNSNPQFTLLEQSLKQDAVFIDTTNKNPDEVADEIEIIINKSVVAVD